MGTVGPISPQNSYRCEGEDRWIAIAAMKDASVNGTAMDLERRVAYAQAKRDFVLKTEDAKEGVQAFAEKWAPVWRGR